MPADFEPVIGLEIHAQLLTDTKIFCGCSTRFGAPPNTNVCPVCLGLPGALPVLNARAVEFAIKAGLSLGCKIQSTSIFARKNYFYPDLPKGYQISQYELPIAVDGAVEYVVAGERRRVGIIRAHLEEDAGKSMHEGFADSDRFTYVDFNRSGVPLLEIVTHPDLRSAPEAADFFERLRAILITTGVNDGNMEEGSLRCDANVSVRPVGETAYGVKAEVKNLNSFRFLQRALEYEIDRQIALICEGGVVKQETRLWDAVANRTVAMRSKEEAHDYRYFPEPDLPPLVVAPARVDELKAELPELPEAKKHRFIGEYALPEYDAEVLTQSTALADYFERTAAASGNPKAASNWVMGEVLRKVKALGIDIEQVSVGPDALAELIKLVEKGSITGPTAKDVLEKMFASGRSADEIVQTEGLARIGDEDTLLRFVHEVIEKNPGPVQQFRAGKTATFGFLVGQVMKAAAGKADPKLVNTLLKTELERGA